MSDAEYEKRLTTTGRNDSCPCGSGKKYKKCHLAADEAERSAALKAAEAEAKARAAENEDEEGDKASTAKGKRGAARPTDTSAGKAPGTDAKPKNIPRRGAI